MSKLKGKINIIDAIVAIIIVVALFSAGVRYISIKKGTQIAGSSVAGAKFSYVVTVKGVREGTLTGIQDSVGLAVTDTKNGNYLGTVESVEFENATTYVTDKAGDIKKSDIEGKYDVFVTITENQGTQTERGYFTQGDKQIYAGGLLNLTVGNIQTSGEVTDMKLK